MMLDVTDRLRRAADDEGRHADLIALYREAADEIDQLREECDNRRAIGQMWERGAHRAEQAIRDALAVPFAGRRLQSVHDERTAILRAGLGEGDE